MKHTKRNSIILALISIVLLYFILKDNFNLTIETLIHASLWWILVSIISYIIAFLADSYSLCVLAKMYNKKYRYIDAIKLNIIAKFFNGVTPFAMGSQPVQVYELHKKDISVPDSVSICVQFFMIFQVALIIIGSIAMITNYFVHFFVKIPLLKELTIFGFIVNIIIFVLLFLISFNKSFNKKIIKIVAKLLSKLKIIKNKEEKIENLVKKCDEVYEASKKVKENKNQFILGILLQCIYLSFLYVTPIFIAYAINVPNNLTIINTIAASAYVYIVGSYVPIPGGSGGMEYGFIGFFSNMIKGPKINSVLLLWRFITYLLPVIIGGIIFNLDFKKKSKE